MTTILMVETDAQLLSAVSRVLSSYDVAVAPAPNLERALQLVRHHDFALGIIDSELVSAAELDAFPDMPLVVTMSYLAAEPARDLARRARLLQKPFTSAELTQLLSEEIQSFSAEGSVLDVLRRAHSGRSSCRLHVGNGEIVLEDGELVHAAFAETRGEAALIRILAGGGAVLRCPANSRVRTIHRPFRLLLLEALGRIEAMERRPEHGGNDRPFLRPLRGGVR